MKRILVLNPAQRLGMLKKGAADVKEHPWFQGFDWKAFASGNMTAPYIPRVGLRAEPDPEYMSEVASNPSFPRDSHCAPSNATEDCSTLIRLVSKVSACIKEGAKLLASHALKSS